MVPRRRCLLRLSLRSARGPAAQESVVHARLDAAGNDRAGAAAVLRQGVELPGIQSRTPRYSAGHHRGGQDGAAGRRSSVLQRGEEDVLGLKQAHLEGGGHGVLPPRNIRHIHAPPVRRRLQGLYSPPRGNPQGL